MGTTFGTCLVGPQSFDIFRAVRHLQLVRQPLPAGRVFVVENEVTYLASLAPDDPVVEFTTFAWNRSAARPHPAGRVSLVVGAERAARAHRHVRQGPFGGRADGD